MSDYCLSLHFLKCKGVSCAIQAAAAVEMIRQTPQEQLCLSHLYSPTGISTMSAVTSALEKANKGFDILFKENRGEMLHGEKREIKMKNGLQQKKRWEKEEKGAQE